MTLWDDGSTSWDDGSTTWDIASLTAAASLGISSTATGVFATSEYTIWDDGATSWDDGATVWNDVSPDNSLLGAASLGVMLGATATLQTVSSIALGGAASLGLDLGSAAGLHAPISGLPIYYEDSQALSIYRGAVPALALYRGETLLWEGDPSEVYLSGSASLGVVPSATATLQSAIAFSGAASLGVTLDSAATLPSAITLSGAASLELGLGSVAILPGAFVLSGAASLRVAFSSAAGSSAMPSVDPIPLLPTAPSRLRQTTFNVECAAFFDATKAVSTAVEAHRVALNAAETAALAARATSELSATTAEGGAWAYGIAWPVTALNTGSYYDYPDTVYTADGQVYRCTSSSPVLGQTLLTTPGAYWVPLDPDPNLLAALLGGAGVALGWSASQNYQAGSSETQVSEQVFSRLTERYRGVYSWSDVNGMPHPATAVFSYSNTNGASWQDLPGWETCQLTYSNSGVLIALAWS